MLTVVIQRDVGILIRSWDAKERSTCIAPSIIAPSSGNDNIVTLQSRNEVLNFANLFFELEFIVCMSLHVLVFDQSIAFTTLVNRVYSASVHAK